MATEHPDGLTAAEWVEATRARTGRGLREGKIVVPCGPEFGCDYDTCEGWQTASADDLPFCGCPDPVPADVRRRGTRQIAADAAKRRRELGA